MSETIQGNATQLLKELADNRYKKLSVISDLAIPIVVGGVVGLTIIEDILPGIGLTVKEAAQTFRNAGFVWK